MKSKTNPKGAGRKPSLDKKIRISTSLAPDVAEYLDSRKDISKAQLIEMAVRRLRDLA